MLCKLSILKDSGGHFEIQNGGIKLHDPDCYHINMLYGDNKLAEKHGEALSLDW